jgi:hydrogenase maturation protease
MPKALVIGYGNPLRTDYGLGWKVCGELTRQVKQEEVELLCCRQLQPEMAERVAKAERVIFVEGCIDGPPGRIAVEDMAPSEKLPSLLSNSIDPYALLACAQQTYGHCPEATMVRVTGECFGVGQTLTPQVAEILPGVVHRVLSLLASTAARHEAAHAD